MDVWVTTRKEQGTEHLKRAVPWTAQEKTKQLCFTVFASLQFFPHQPVMEQLFLAF